MSPLQQRTEVTLPALEKLVDLEHVVGVDRRRVGEADGLGRERAGDDETEGGAPAARAVDLDERQVVAVGEEADAPGRDDGVADGASDTVGQRT